VTKDLIDFNVNQNTGFRRMLSKAGLFGVDWKNTPFMDNKAAFQLGVNQVIRRTASSWSTGSAACAARRRSTRTFRTPQAISPITRMLVADLLAALRPAIDHRNVIATAMRNRSDAFNKELADCSGQFDARPTICCSFSTVSPAISARPPTSCASAWRRATSGGSIRARTTGSGSPTGSSTPITAS
jgi:hypothetical protein